jgi:hypothetical protein
MDEEVDNGFAAEERVIVLIRIILEVPESFQIYLTKSIMQVMTMKTAKMAKKGR